MLARMAAIRAADHARPKRWTPSRLIVQNWWYFTYQEFHFVGGRLVLNGANGSGKSTVEALAVPVALDMVKSRQRFDPFGGTQKHPSFYLLGLPQARPGTVGYHDARIGYVVWEFQHGETEEYLSIGVGLMAKRSDGVEPPLDSWGFVLPGKRLGQDFQIASDRNPFSRTALEAHLGRQHVYRTAHEYQGAVNEALFGFERAEDLRHLTDTLVELRKPKLVKDVSADELSASLQNALPALPRESGERLAHLIKNIDEATEALAATEDQIRRVDEINTAQAQYANRLAQQSAVRVQQEAGNLAKAVGAHENTTKELIEYQIKRDALAAEIETLDGELQTAEGSLEAKRSSEAYKSLESLEVAESALRAAHGACWTVERSYTDRKQEVARFDTQQERLEQQFHSQIAEIEARIEDIGAAAANARWAATTVRLDQVRVALTRNTIASEPPAEDDPAVALDEARIVAEGRERERHLRGVEAALQEVADREREHDLADQALRVAQVNLAAADDALSTAQDDLSAQRGALGDALAEWTAEVEDHVSIAQPLATVLEAVEGFTGDVIETEPLVAPLVSAVREAERTWQGQAKAADRELMISEQQRDETIKERDQLEAQEFAPPPGRPGQEAARTALAAAGVSAVPLYAAVDFAPDVALCAQVQIESALEEAGLLDALVIAECDRPRVHALIAQGVLGGEIGDRWLVPAAAGPLAPDMSLATLLVPASELLPADAIQAILGTVGNTLAAPGAHVTSAGRWRQGVLEGIAGISETAETPRYIGATNRRRRREEALARLATTIAALEAKIRTVRDRQAEAANIAGALEDARKDLETLPALRKLSTGAVVLRHARDQQRRAADQVTKADQELERARQQVRQAKALLEGALSPVPEARGFARDQVIDIRNATQRTVALCRELGRELGGLEGLRDAERQRRADRAEAIQRTEEIMGQLTQARGDVARAEARVAAISELLGGLDAMRLREEVAQLGRQIGELGKRIREREKALGEAKGKVEKLDQRVGELRDERIRVEADYRAAAMQLEQRLRAYPEDGLTHALVLFEDVARGPEVAAADLLKRRRPGTALAENVARDLTDASNALVRAFQAHRSDLAAFRPDINPEQRVTFVTVVEQQRIEPYQLLEERRRVEEEQRRVVSEEEHKLYVDFFLNDVIAQIRRQVIEAEAFVREMNDILAEMKISNGAAFRITWAPREQAGPGAVNYKRLVDYVKLDPDAVTPERRDAMVLEFRQRVEAVRAGQDARNLESYRDRLSAEFDYRSWFQFRFYFQKPGESEFELRERGMGRLSGGERTLAQILPLLAAVHARSLSARPDALKVFALDEPFAGVDAHNIQEVLEVLVRLEFSWIFAGESFWGDSPVVPGCASYLLRSQPGVVMAMLFVWDGTRRIAEKDMRDQRPPSPDPVSPVLS